MAQYYDIKSIILPHDEDELHIMCGTAEIEDGAVTDAKLDQVGVPTSINMLANTLSTRMQLQWEAGGISGDTGEDISLSNNYRTVGYISLQDVEYCQGGSAYTIYAYFYSYDETEQAYTYLQRKRLLADDATSTLATEGATHMRLTRYTLIGISDGVPFVGVKTGLSNRVASLEAGVSIGYWRNSYQAASGSQHSASKDVLKVSVSAGEKFAFRHQTDVVHSYQIFAFEPDGASHRLATVSRDSFPYVDNYYVFAAEYDIVGIGTFFTAQSQSISVTQSVYLAGSLAGDLGMPLKSGYYIESDEAIQFLQVGRDRTLRQCVAVLGNDLWEFGQGSASSGGVTYALDNGHGNNCNWGSVSHGDYPYLYCPQWSDGHTIKVLSFDGEAFTVADTIDVGSYSGHLNAYVDEDAWLIYALVNTSTDVGDVKFVVADMTGTVISETDAPYRIPAIQGMCMHRGTLLVTGGLGSSSNPSYIYKIATNGTLLDKRLVYGIGEIEGICYLMGHLVVASYNKLLWSAGMSPADKIKDMLPQVGDAS